MTKKILYIVLGAIFVFGILFLLWSWLFSGKGINTQTNGQFGTSTDATLNNGSNTGGQTNGEASTGQNTSNGSITLGNNGQNGTAGGSTNGGTNGATTGAGTNTVFTTTSVGGVQWLGGAGSGGGGVTSAGGGAFNASAVNQVANSNPSGTGPTIITANPSSGLDLSTALIAAGVGTAACTAGLLGGSGLAALANGATLGSTAATSNTISTAYLTGNIWSIPTGIPANSVGANAGLYANAQINANNSTLLAVGFGVNNTLKANDTFKADFLDCVTRAIARAALQQITASIVNWINSGFNGSPSFITNPTQFFTNIADSAAGAYIQGSALSFLCSPFSLQIKIAVAQAYAKNQPSSCTLSKVTNNITSFMNGNFAQGGWPSFISFTTTPTNNPYGAYAYAQIGLNNSVANAQSAQQTQLNQGNGFLSTTKQTNCKAGVGPTGPIQTCDTTVVTPGTVVQDSLKKALGNGVDQLNIANSFDQIVSAFMTQLATKTLQSGLLSQTAGAGYLTPDQQLAQTQAQTLLTNMQASVELAQQYGDTLQGSISDLQSAQQSISEVAGCWSGYASTTLSASKQAQAAANANADQAKIAQLQTQVDSYNNLITNANNAIAQLQQMESGALSVNSTADVTALQAQYTSAQTSGVLVGSNDVTNAQQNRATLQSSLATTNQATQAEGSQCQAFGQN